MTRLEEIKKRKPFAVWDLLIYAILVAVILLLFGLFVFGGSGKAASGIKITSLNGKVIYTYQYGKNKGEIAADWADRVEEKKENGILIVSIYFNDEKKDFNVLEIDTSAKTAFMRDANCSFRKDCTKTKSISSERDIIVCLPHKIKVCALGGENGEISGPIIG